MLDAPREMVWQAFTDPERISRWWGPDGFTTTTHHMDFKPSGVWRFTMHGPDGTWRVVHRAPDGREHPFKGVYKEILAPQRIVRTFIYDVEGIRDYPSTETITFEEHDGRTILTNTILHLSQQARDGHLLAGVERGATESMDRLAELLAALASSGANAQRPSSSSAMLRDPA